MENENSHDRRHLDHREQSRTGQEYGRVHQVHEREQHDHERYSHAREHVQKAGQGAEPHHEHPKRPTPDETGVTLFINHKSCHSKDSRINAAAVRKLSVPPIDDDNDIFHVVAGAGRVKMNDFDFIEINMHEEGHGRHFESALKPSALASRQEKLEKKAYFIYLERGRKHGNDVNDWLEAEADMLVNKQALPLHNGAKNAV